MADDSPVCSRCGSARVPMKNGRGTWYVGCPTCKPGTAAAKGKQQGKEQKPDTQQQGGKPAEKGGGGGGFTKWIDSILD